MITKCATIVIIYKDEYIIEGHMIFQTKPHFSILRGMFTFGLLTVHECCQLHHLSKYKLLALLSEQYIVKCWSSFLFDCKRGDITQSFFSLLILPKLTILFDSINFLHSFKEETKYRPIISLALHILSLQGFCSVLLECYEFNIPKRTSILLVDYSNS